MSVHTAADTSTVPRTSKDERLARFFGLGRNATAATMEIADRGTVMRNAQCQLR